jgi:fatty-acid desaturase
MPEMYASQLAPFSQVWKQLTRYSQVVFAAEISFIVVVYVSKIAVSLLLHRLASQRFKRVYAIAIIAASCAFCIASVLAVAIHHTGTPWLSSQNSAHPLVSET